MWNLTRDTPDPLTPAQTQAVLSGWPPRRQAKRVRAEPRRYRGSRRHQDLVKGSTLKSFNRKTLLKAARYRDPTDTEAWGEVVVDEDIDETQPMDMVLGSDVE